MKHYIGIIEMRHKPVKKLPAVSCWHCKHADPREALTCLKTDSAIDPEIARTCPMFDDIRVKKPR